MARTTVDIATPLLAELRQRAREQQRTLGAVVSELLAEALARRREPQESPRTALRWVTRSMGQPIVNLEDKDALARALDADRLDEVAEP